MILQHVPPRGRKQQGGVRASGGWQAKDGQAMTRHHELSDYRVQVGHWQFRLQASTAEEAVQQARSALVRELPRLYDVIRDLTASRFRVEQEGH